MDNLSTKMLAEYQGRRPGTAAIGFFADVAAAQAACRTFLRAGIAAETWTAGMSANAKYALVQAVRRGEIKALFGGWVAAPGELPPVFQVALVGRPTRSVAVHCSHYAAVGKTGLVLDFVGNMHRYMIPRGFEGTAVSVLHDQDQKAA